MTPTLNLSAHVRLAIYVATGIGSAVVAYLVAKDLIGDAEVTLWATIAALVNGLSALNVSTTPERDEHGHVDLAVVVLIGILVLLVLVIVGRV